MENDDDVHGANPDQQLFVGPGPLQIFAGPEPYLCRGRWMAKSVVRLLVTAALWVRIQTSLKIQNGRHKQKGVANTL